MLLEFHKLPARLAKLCVHGKDCGLAHTDTIIAMITFFFQVRVFSHPDDKITSNGCEHRLRREFNITCFGTQS